MVILHSKDTDSFYQIDQYYLVTKGDYIMKINPNSKVDISNIIQFVDPIHTLLRRDSGLYKLWYYGREILPGHPNHDYMIGTSQAYLFPSYMRDPEFAKLCCQFQGFRELYHDALIETKNEDRFS